MRCLTVRQPWAWGLIHGPKRIENRGWRTSYRGPLLIHAGSSRLSLGEEGSLLPGLPPYEELVYGAIIGVVDLADIALLEDVRDDPFASGPWCWIVRDPRPLELHYCPGG